MASTVKRTERGWAGHFACSDKCRFRRNTLLTYGDTMIVVSSVGLMSIKGYSEFETIGHDRHYETMAFHAMPGRHSDSNVSREVFFESPWAIAELDADDKANDMHETVVDEITAELLAGRITND